MNALLRVEETVFPHLLDAAWKATALIPLVFVLTRILRKKRPVARYWLWVYCLVGLLALPVASFFVGEHGMPLLPASVPEAVLGPPGPSSEKIVLTADTPAKNGEGYEAEILPVEPEEETGRSAPGGTASPPEVVGDIENPPEKISPAESPNSESAQAANPEDVTTEESSVTSTQPEAREESPSAATLHASQPVGARSHASHPSPFSWRAAIGFAWMAGFTAMFARLLFASVALARLRRSSRPVSDAALLRLFDEVKQTCGFRTSVQLRTARRVTSPVSVGILHPMVLLPESLPDEMPADQLRPILLHELGHVRWRDHAINVVQRLLEALFFFHPFVHLLNRHLRSLREEICDAWVMSHCHSATLYARALTALAERWLARGGNPIGVGLFNHRVHLPERIKRILTLGKTLPATLRLRTAILLLAVSLLAVAWLSLVSLSAREAKAESEKGAGQKKTTASAQAASEERAITWKDDVVYRDGKPYAKIVQWEPEADLPMVAFGDQNNNGKTDIWIRFLNGKPLRIEIDGNEDGRIDKWEHYFDGVVDLVEVDTDFNRKVDLWQVYDNGELFREEIDLNADGSVDKWLEVDDKGKLVEKEILSWVVRELLEERYYDAPRRASLYRPAQATFFNAADRVEKQEVQGGSRTGAAAPPSGWMAATAPPGQPQFLYHPLTGCRIEYTKDVGGSKVVAGWFHESLQRDVPPGSGYWGDTPARPRERQPVRYLGLDIGFDGGVDKWGQVGRLATETPPPGSGRRRGALSSALWDDTNRDGKADRVYATLGSDPYLRQLPSQVYQTDSNGDGLVDRLGGRQANPFRLDADHDGVFESFDPQRRLSPLIEATGTSSLRMELKLTGGPQPAPLLCTLTIPGVMGGWPYRRGFWLTAGEPVVVPKLSRGVYDLSVSIGDSGDPDDYRATTFSYPGFLVLEKGQSVSKRITWDTRPVFKGRFISAYAKPLARQRAKIATPGGAFASLSLYTDAAGDFELINVPPGRCTLTLGSGTEAFQQTIEIPVAGEKEPERQLFLTWLPSGDVEIPAGWEAPLALSGKVLSHDGHPLANLLVKVSPLGRERIIRTVVTGLDGSYRIFALMPGFYSVSIYNNDFPEARASLQELQLQIQQAPMQKDFRLSAPLPVIIE